MKVIGRVGDETLPDLGSEKIHLGHAYELGRVSDPQVQERLFNQVKQFDISVSDTRDLVDQTLEIIKSRQTNPTTAPVAPAIPVSVIKCGICGEDRPISQVRGVNICLCCYPVSQAAVQKAKAPEAQAPQEPRGSGEG